MRCISAIIASLVVFVGNVPGVQGAEPGSADVDSSRLAPTVASGNSAAGSENPYGRQPAWDSQRGPRRTPAADHVRFGVAGNLLNYGKLDQMHIAAWSPGGELFVAFPLARWTSIGLRVGYQQFNAVTVYQYQVGTINGPPSYSPWTRPPQHQLRVLGEWSAYAPLLQDRLELGGRLSLGRMKPYGQEQSAGVELGLSATAVYWFCSWLGGLSEIGSNANLFPGPGADPGDRAPVGTFLLSWKVGALVRF